MKRIGILYDKDSKKRFLLPNEIKQLTAKGISVSLAKDYGMIHGMADATYQQAGAKVFEDWKNVVENSDILLKVGAFNKGELEIMSGKIAITMANYFNNVDMLLYMLQNKVTGIEWAALADKNGYIIFPKLEELKASFVFNEIKKALSTGLAKKPKDKVVYPTKPKMLILNATFGGLALAKLASNNFDVTIADNDLTYLQNLKKSFPEIKICDSKYETLLEQFPTQNIFVSTMINPSDLTKLRITKEMAVRMPRGSLLVDMSAENGYAFHFVKKFPSKEFKWVSIDKSFFVAPCDFSEFVGKKASEIISTNSVQFLIDVAENGRQSSWIVRNTNCENGKVINAAINNKLCLY